MHLLRRLAEEIMPCLRELDERDWTPEEYRFLKEMEHLEGRSLTESEKRMWIAQAKMVGHV